MQSTSRYRARWLIDIGVCVSPAMIAFIIVLLVRANAYIQLTPRNNTEARRVGSSRIIYPEPSIIDAINYAWRDFVNALDNCGPISVVLLTVNYVAAFGALGACCIIFRRFTTTKRLWCFWFVSLAVLLGFAHLAGYARQSDLVWGAHMIMNRFDTTHYYEFLISYPPIAVPIALITGWLISMLPIFKPGKRYWISRGMCPKCHYDLKGDIDQGCPECGWNRSTPKRAGSGTRPTSNG